MSNDDYLTRSREAGEYMQTFIRGRMGDFADVARGSSRHEGWLGKGVDEAHNAAMFLWHYTDEHFLNCRIPEDFGSPAALTAALRTLCEWLIHARDELRDIARLAGSDAATTVSMTLSHIEDTLFAAEETLRQLANATREATGQQQEVYATTVSPQPIEKVQEIANRFPAVVAQMKNRRKPRKPIIVEDEYDVQYLFQGLLAASFLDIRPEEPTPSVAGGSGRADTFLKPERIVVEYKCTRSGLGAKELRKQIADDFLLYGRQAECDRLFVFIYDAHHCISNPKGFEDDLTVTVDGLHEVRVVVRH